MKKLILITSLFFISLSTFSQAPPNALIIENKHFMIMEDGCYGKYIESVSNIGVRHRVYIGEYIGTLQDNRRVFKVKSTPYTFYLDKKANLQVKELTAMELIRGFNLFKR